MMQTLLGKAVNRSLRYLEQFGLLLKRTGYPHRLVDFVLMPVDKHKIKNTFAAKMGFAPNYLNPKTFNEWQQFTKIHFRQPRHTIMADKVRARDYIASKIGTSMLAKLYWSGTNLRTVDLSMLPDKFVIKVNQSSGRNIFVTNKWTMDWQHICHKAHSWLEQDHSMYFAEWEYRWIPPQLLIEEYLESDRKTGLIEYQFFCIGGRCALVEVDFDRHTNHSRLYFDRDFQRVNLRIRLPVYEGQFRMPPFYHQMLTAAETLSSDEYFLRVDFLDAGRPYIGELSFHPGGAIVPFDPPEWDAQLGRLFAEYHGAKIKSTGVGSSSPRFASFFL